jgi:hypothetical protein
MDAMYKTSIERLTMSNDIYAYFCLEVGHLGFSFQEAPLLQALAAGQAQRRTPQVE